MAASKNRGEVQLKFCRALSLFFPLVGLVFGGGCRITHQKKGVQMYNGMEFQSFTLKNNLQVLTISHKSFVKSSAALAVRAGSMENPDEHLGLAHFLEHLLFLGTEEFPEVGEYENFLNKNGGGHNAYTSIDHTNYFFDVNHGAFEGGLKRFSRFFVSPTFDAKYVSREKEAVNSEHEKNREDDSRREYRMQQILSKPSHPFSKFATGDKNTLKQADQKEVRDFYETHYSANLMRLVLMSDASSEQLKKWARDHFEDIKDRKLKAPEYDNQLFPKDQLPRQAFLKTIRDKNSLKISFDTPDEMPYWESKPLQFIAHIVGDEGEGSLLSLLKREGLALELGTSTWWKTFNTSITLTDKGTENIELILRYFFAYIDKLKATGLERHVFDQKQQLAEVELKNIEAKSSMGRASEYSATMLYHPVDSFLQRTYLYHKHSNEDFQKFLSFVRPDNMQLLISGQTVKVDQTEPFYGAEYSLKKLDTSFLKQPLPEEVLSQLVLPKANPFVPDDFSLVTSPGVKDPQAEKSATLGTLYTQVDTELQIPKASLSLNFISDVIGTDPKLYATAQLYAMAKRQELNEWGYPARLAGIHYNVSHGNSTVSIEVGGYNQHLSAFLQKLIRDPENNRRIDEVRLDKNLFKKLKKKFRQSLYNSDYDAAYQALLYENTRFVNTGGVHRNLFRDQIESISLDDVNGFAKKFFAKTAIKGLSFGNIKSSAIKEAAQYFRDQISAASLSDEDVEKFENKYIDTLGLKGRLEFFGKNNNNSSINFYPMAPWNIRNQARVEILGKVIEQPFFTELRTNQQLGYIVAAFSTASHGYAGLGTLVQSESHSTADIYERSHKFFSDFVGQLSQRLTDKEIEPIKNSLIDQYRKKPNSLQERTSQFFHLAGTYHGDFKFVEKIVLSLKAITADELKKFIESSFKEKSFESQLSLLYFSSDTKDRSVPATSPKKIEDAVKLKSERKRSQPYKQSKAMTGKP